MDADLLGQLHLGQLPLPPQLADLASDEFELCRPVHGWFVDFYAIEQ
jgi:hypothetical protein